MDVEAVSEPDAATVEAELRSLGLRYVSDGDARHHAPPRRQRLRLPRAPTARPLQGRGHAAPGSASSRSRRPGRDVWISPFRDGHLLATGRDAQGPQAVPLPPALARRPRRRPSSSRMLAFGKALPRIRAAVEADLAGRGLGRAQGAGHGRAPARDDADPGRQRRVRQGQQVLRPHHDAQPARQGRGRAAAVPLPRQVAASRTSSRSSDRRLAALVRRMPGAAGPGAVPVPRRGRRVPARVNSGDVNDYLREIAAATSPPRTSAPGRRPCWPPGRSASSRPSTARRPPSATSPRRSSAWPARLGNTPAICRKCYVHPEVLDAYLDGSLVESLKAEIEARAARGAGGPRARGGGGAGLPAAAAGARGCRQRPRSRPQPDPAMVVAWPTPDQGADHGQSGDHAAPGAGASAHRVNGAV